MRRSRRISPEFAVSAVIAGLLLAAAGHGHPGAPAPRHPARAAGAAATAIGYARRQIGKPYAWGGTGPEAFDCSGLVMQAYAAAGVTLPRTSQQQWAQGPRVASPAPGDLVFFAGIDGTPSAPGHVGLVTGPHQMIEAYATGFPIRYAQFGTAGAPPGDSDPVGFTDPAGGGP